MTLVITFVRSKYTNNCVAISSESGFAFKDLMTGYVLTSSEVYIVASKAAQQEAAIIMNVGDVPINYSHDKHLSSFVVQALDCGANEFCSTLFKTLPVWKQYRLDYCQAVLLCMIMAAHFDHQSKCDYDYVRSMLANMTAGGDIQIIRNVVVSFNKNSMFRAYIKGQLKYSTDSLKEISNFVADNAAN